MDRIELTYSKPLIARTIRAYWFQQVGLALPIVTLAMAALAVYLLQSGDRSWLLGAVSVAVVLSVSMMIAIYLVQLRRSLAKFESMGERRAVLIMGVDKLRIESNAGASELPWSSITRARQYDDFWLLYLDSAVFFTIPTAGLDDSEMESVNRRISASGARIG